MFASELTMSDKQLDLFLFSDERRGFKRVKKQPCIDCGETEIELIYNDQSTIYEGLRTCDPCLTAFKRRYYDGGS